MTQCTTFECDEAREKRYKESDPFLAPSFTAAALLRAAFSSSATAAAAAPAAAADADFQGSDV